MNSHRFLNDVSKVGIVSSIEKYRIYKFYIDLVNDYPQLLKKNVTFNPSAQPYLATIKAQTWMNLRDMITLNQSVKEEIAETIGLNGRYLDIWDEFSVLVIDNNGFDSRQLEVIYNLLSKIPKSLHELGSITCNDLLGNTGERYLWFNTKMSVNIFDIKVGAWQENGFPDDVEPMYSDVFTLVLAHEVNHAVDAHLTTDKDFRIRKADLIRRAGNNSMNYLRSMFENDFFIKYPQEFFASISNQWFSNTSRTLELALARFKKGYSEPINQFLFFADAYSLKSNETLFYTLGTQGNIEREVVPITRDAHGHINSISYRGILYHFTSDENGNVLKVSLNPPLFRLGINVFRNQDVYVADEIDVYNANMMLVNSVSHAYNYSTVLPLGTYFVNASITFNSKTYSSQLKEINLSQNLTIGIIFRFANQILIRLVDISGNPVNGATVSLYEVGENMTDNIGQATFRDVYFGNWSVMAKKYGFPILNATLIVNQTRVSANYTVMLGDFKVKVFDQYGKPLEKVEVSLVNREWNLSFSQTMQKQEECVFKQIPITAYMLTVQSPYGSRIYSIDLKLTRQIDVKVVVVEVVPLWVYGLLMAALASVLVIASIEIRRRKLR
jgi:hypothetical protein